MLSLDTQWLQAISRVPQVICGVDEIGIAPLAEANGQPIFPYAETGAEWLAILEKGGGFSFEVLGNALEQTYVADALAEELKPGTGNLVAVAHIYQRARDKKIVVAFYIPRP